MFDILLSPEVARCVQCARSISVEPGTWEHKQIRIGQPPVMFCDQCKMLNQREAMMMRGATLPNMLH